MACIRKRRNRWVVDFRDKRGKRHWKTFTTRKAADDALTDLKGEIKAGTYRDPATLPTFAQVAADWLNLQRDHAAATVGYYRNHVEGHLVPRYGDRRIDLVSRKDIEQLRNDKRDGANGQAGLARATINQLLQTLTSILEYAIEHGFIVVNPGKTVKRVRAERRAGAAGVMAVDPKEVLTAEQAAAVIDAAKPGLYRAFIMTALHSGARSGELLALRWQDVDLEAGALRIERSLSWVRSGERGYGKSTPVYGPPKTDSSYRTLDLAPDLVRELKVWKLQSRYKQAEDLIFTNSLGKPLHRAFLHKGLGLAIRGANAARETRAPEIPHVDLHGLRHTFASLMIQLGKPISQVANLLGHKNPDVTLKVYTHWFRAESSASAMADLAAALRPASGSKTVAIVAERESAAAK